MLHNEMNDMGFSWWYGPFFIFIYNTNEEIATELQQQSNLQHQRTYNEYMVDACMLAPKPP